MLDSAVYATSPANPDTDQEITTLCPRAQGLLPQPPPENIPLGPSKPYTWASLALWNGCYEFAELRPQLEEKLGE